MGEYLSPLAGARGNLVISAEDGSVWANYLLRGAQLIPSSAASVAAAQEANISLFQGLSHMPTTDVYLGAIKVRVDPKETANRIVQGVSKISGASHPVLLDRVRAVHQEMQYGRLKEYRRVYLLSVKIPTGQTAAAQALVKAGKVDVLDKVDWEQWDEYQRQFLEKIPRAFYRRKSDLMVGPEFLVWMHERMRLRGLDVPMAPSGAEQGFNPRGFTQVMVNKAADTEPLFDEFLETTAKGWTPEAIKGRWRQFLRNYRSALRSGQVAVYSPEERTAALPDGPASRQSLLAVTGYPQTPQVVLNTFTSLVDRDPTVDADFALRMHFDQSQISVDQHRAFEKVVQSEADANARDRHDEAGYAGQKAEREALGRSVQAETAPRAMAVTTIFALAHPEAEKLRQAKQDLSAKLQSTGFSVLGAVGGQFDLLRQMLPCVATSEQAQDFKGGTTVEQFGACMPIRRTEAGDDVGIPFAVNRENALGQIVLLDMLGSTDKGSGSIAFTGAQGSGKSMELKTLIDWLYALRVTQTIFDHSSVREYLVFAQSLGVNCQVIEVLRPKVSFDPLKVFAADPDRAQEVIIELFQILTGWKVDSPELLLLSDLVQPGMRRSKDIHSLRDLLRVVNSDGSVRNRAGADALGRTMSFWAGQRAYNTALFDPINQAGDVQAILPPYQRASVDTSVVFVTNGLKLHRGAVTDQTPPLNRYSTAMFTLMARLTQQDFAAIDGLCAMIGDEVAFWDGSDVIEQMVGEYDKTGRKEKNIGIFAGQLPKHMSSGAYDLIRRRVALRQETVENATDALNWVGMPATAKQVRRMVAETSPPDPNDNNRPTAGREGEGWYNDGFGNVVRAQQIPMFTAEGMRLADTTSSRLIRASDLEASAAASPAAGAAAGGARG